MEKILVQACCAPCSTAFFGWEKSVDFFFNGDNFDCADEYERRAGAMRILRGVAFPNSKVFFVPYAPRTFGECAECIRYRLLACARVAKAEGYDAFTTSLTVSPHKNTKMVNEIGAAVGAEVGVAFLALDLKKRDGFKRTVELSRRFGLYRQNYCGCAKRSVAGQ